MTHLDGSALRLTIILRENDQWHHHPVYTEVVHRAHKFGLAGASVFRGIEGFGKSARIHTSRILSLSEDLPCSIVIVDLAERIEAFLPELDELVSEGIVMLDDVRVLKYVSRSEERSEA